MLHSPNGHSPRTRFPPGRLLSFRLVCINPRSGFRPREHPRPRREYGGGEDNAAGAASAADGAHLSGCPPPQVRAVRGAPAPQKSPRAEKIDPGGKKKYERKPHEMRRGRVYHRLRGQARLFLLFLSAHEFRGRRGRAFFLPSPPRRKRKTPPRRAGGAGCVMVQQTERRDFITSCRPCRLPFRPCRRRRHGRRSISSPAVRKRGIRS